MKKKVRDVDNLLVIRGSNFALCLRPRLFNCVTVFTAQTDTANYNMDPTFSEVKGHVCGGFSSFPDYDVSLGTGNPDSDYAVWTRMRHGDRTGDCLVPGGGDGQVPDAGREKERCPGGRG